MATISAPKTAAPGVVIHDVSAREAEAPALRSNLLRSSNDDTGSEGLLHDGRAITMGRV